MAFDCDEHAARLSKLESAKGSRWIPVLVALVGSGGLVGSGWVAARYELQKTRETMAAQSEEQLRQKTVKLVLEVSEQKRQEAYEQGRRDGKTEGRSEALTEALEAAKREGVASKSRKR